MVVSSGCQIHQSHTSVQRVQQKDEHSSGTASGLAKRRKWEKSGAAGWTRWPLALSLDCTPEAKGQTRPIAALKDSLISSYAERPTPKKKQLQGCKKKKEKADAVNERCMEWVQLPLMENEPCTKRPESRRSWSSQHKVFDWMHKKQSEWLCIIGAFPVSQCSQGVGKLQGSLMFGNRCWLILLA